MTRNFVPSVLTRTPKRVARESAATREEFVTMRDARRAAHAWWRYPASVSARRVERMLFENWGWD